MNVIFTSGGYHCQFECWKPTALWVLRWHDAASEQTSKQEGRAQVPQSLKAPAMCPSTHVLPLLVNRICHDSKVSVAASLRSVD